MEDEIDLRKYAGLLARRWRWIVASTGLAALLAALISFISPPTYEATASVFVLPGLAVASASAPSLSPQSELALLQSDGIAQSTIKVLGEKVSLDEARALLRGDSIRVSADNADKSLFRISAQANAAQMAVDIANTWAATGADEINAQYAQAQNIAVPALQGTVDTSAKQLQTAEESLQQARRDLKVDTLNTELATMQQILNSQLGVLENVRLALGQANTLRTEVQQGQIGLTAEMLLNLQTAATAGGSQLLIQPSQISSLTRPQQMAQMDAVIAALEARQQARAASLASTTSQVDNLQQQLNDKQTALIAPTKTRDFARADYDRATAQLRDAQIRLAAWQKPMRVILAGQSPVNPIAPKKPLNIAAGALLGLLLGVGMACTAEYVGKPRPA